MQNDASVATLRTFAFDRRAPHIPQELLRLMIMGSEIVELDEKLFFHIKFHLRSLIFFESAHRYGIRVGPGIGDVAEFVADYASGEERFYMKPPRMIDN